MMTLRPALLRCAVGSLRTAPQIFRPNMGAAGVSGSTRFLGAWWKSTEQDPTQGKSMENSMDAEMEQEMKDKISSIQVQLGDRRAEMLVDFNRAAPSLGPLALDHLATGIDKHEDFGNPESFRHEVSNGELRLHHSTPGDPWHVHLTRFSSLPLCEQNALEAAVRSQIEKQKEIFPRRSIVKAASDKHFLPFLDGMKNLMDGIEGVRYPKAKKIEAEEATKEMLKLFHNFFQDMENQEVDVKTALLDPWKPLSLCKAAAWHAHLVKLASEMNVPPDGPTLHVLLLLQAYENWLRSQAERQICK